MLPLDATERRYLLQAARHSLASYLRSGHRPVVRTESAALLQVRAAFVTLQRVDNGELRGCRGEAEPRRPLVESVTANAIAAAVDDPRFEPVTIEEFEELDMHISALTAPAPIQAQEVVLGQHGLVIRHGRRCGLLLPQVPALYGLGDVPSFLHALCRKAGLPPEALHHPDTKLLGFEAETWGDEDPLE